MGLSRTVLFSPGVSVSLAKLLWSDPRVQGHTVSLRCPLWQSKSYAVHVTSSTGTEGKVTDRMMAFYCLINWFWLCSWTQVGIVIWVNFPFLSYVYAVTSFPQGHQQQGWKWQRKLSVLPGFVLKGKAHRRAWHNQERPEKERVVLREEAEWPGRRRSSQKGLLQTRIFFWRLPRNGDPGWFLQREQDARGVSR